MVNKKPVTHKKEKPAAKKTASKPAPHKTGKPAAKKPVSNSAPHKTEKPAVKKPAAKPASHQLRKETPKKAAKPVVKKPISTPVTKQVVTVTAKPAPKPVVLPQPKPVVQPAPKQEAKKSGAADRKSLVSIKPVAKPVLKKEPPKAGKIVIPKTTTRSAVKYQPDFTKSVLDTLPMSGNNGPTMRYSDADLVEFKEIIGKKLDAAKKELAYLQGLIIRRDGEGGDMDEARYMTMEDGSVSMEREQLSQMASRQITFIDHLEKANMRIENKTYGVCRVTGKLIDKARLRAVPHATLSIEAKQMMNK